MFSEFRYMRKGIVQRLGSSIPTWAEFDAPQHGARLMFMIMEEVVKADIVHLHDSMCSGLYANSYIFDAFIQSGILDVRQLILEASRA